MCSNNDTPIMEIEKKLDTYKLMSWEKLNTIGGTGIISNIIVQLTKNFADKVCESIGFHLNTNLYVYIVVVTIMLLAKYFLDELNIKTTFLTLINAIIVSMITIGSYHTIINDIFKFFELE
jgi:hypothetical protein